MSGVNTSNNDGKASYQKARAGFILKGTTLTEWCKANGTHIQNVRAAFFGDWNGPGAEKIKRRVTEASGTSD